MFGAKIKIREAYNFILFGKNYVSLDLVLFIAILKQFCIQITIGRVWNVQSSHLEGGDNDDDVGDDGDDDDDDDDFKTFKITLGNRESNIPNTYLMK